MPRDADLNFRKILFYKVVKRKDEDEFLEFWDGHNLIRLKNSFCRYVDKTFVTEFVEYGNDLNHQKALILLERLLDKEQEYFPELTGEQADVWIIQSKRDEFDRVAISALSSLQANKRQRNEIFGF